MFFLQTESLLPEITATNPNVVTVCISTYIPCANGLMYLFDDLPYPAAALTCIKNIQPTFLASQANILDDLVKWLKVMCQQARTGACSSMITSWTTMQNDDVALHQWGQGMHDMMLPPLPMSEPASITTTPAGLTDTKTRDMLGEEARTARVTESFRAGCRHIADLEWQALRGYVGLTVDAIRGGLGEHPPCQPRNKGHIHSPDHAEQGDLGHDLRRLLLGNHLHKGYQGPEVRRHIVQDVTVQHPWSHHHLQVELDLKPGGCSATRDQGPGSGGGNIRHDGRQADPTGGRDRGTSESDSAHGGAGLLYCCPPRHMRTRGIPPRTSRGYPYHPAVSVRRQILATKGMYGHLLGHISGWPSLCGTKQREGNIGT